MKNIFLPLIFSVAFFFSAAAQSKVMDSLKLALKSAKHDTTRCNILNAIIEEEQDDNVWPTYNEELRKIAEHGVKISPEDSPEGKVFKQHLISALNNEGVRFYNSDFNKALGYFEKALGLYREMGDTNGIIVSLNNKGAIYRMQGNIPKQLECLFQCQEMAEKINDKELLATVLYNINVAYADLGEMSRALDYLYRGLRIREQIGDELGIAKCQRSIASFHATQGEYEKSNELFLKSLETFKKFNATVEIGMTYNNLGTNYLDLNDTAKALAYFTKGINLYKESGNAIGLAVVMHNKAKVYYKAGDFKKALELYQESLGIKEDLGDKEGMAVTLQNIGSIYLEQADISHALTVARRSFDLANQVGNPKYIQSAAELLSRIYRAQGNYRDAFSMYELHITMRDSLNNQEVRKNALQKQFQYQYEKKAAADSIKVSEERKVVAARLKQERTQRFSLYGGLALVTVFSLFMVNRFRVTNKQKKIIEVKEQEALMQKHMVEEKQREILDSITYAKRLQQAILPPEAYIGKYLHDFFILYKPKDIVAGDFYFFDHREDTVFIAAADCTGHGVPGAMVSVVCANALNRTINEFGITDTGKILDKTRELVVETFAKSESEVKDGMDISLCSINLKAREICWSGANNPLWYLQDGQLVEIKADKQPIGNTYEPRPFTTHKLTLDAGSIIYLITDGYADQFGGPKGKKFKYKQLEQQLLDMKERPLQEQKKELERSFTEWQGNLEQVDDVTIIGIRV